MNPRVEALTADLTEADRRLAIGNALRSQNLVGGRISDHVATAVREILNGTLTAERDAATAAEFRHHQFR